VVPATRAIVRRTGFESHWRQRIKSQRSSCTTMCGIIYYSQGRRGKGDQASQPRDGRSNRRLLSASSKTRLGTGYWKLWTATTISNVGDGVRFAALPLLATTLTRDPLLVAGTVFASQLPWLLFALVSGALVDRLDRRAVMLAANLFRASAMILLGLAVLSDFDNLVLVYVIVFLLGTAETLFDSASFALLPALVDTSNLERANGPLQATVTFNQEFVGPPLGALLFAIAAPAPFFVDAASFALAAGIVFSIRGGGGPEREEGALVASLKEEVVEGLRWVWSQPVLRGIMTIAAVMNIVFFATFSIRVLFATEILGLDTTGFGFLMAADGGGGLLGALTAARVSGRIGRGPALVVAVGLQAASTLVFGLTSAFWIGWLALAVGGVSGFLWNVVAISVAQALTPDRLLGRLNSAINTVSWGAIPIGAALGGLLARSFGLRVPYFAGALLLAAMGLVALRLRGHLAEVLERSD
jgi:predicted MFS family arabinose efflux permease